MERQLLWVLLLAVWASGSGAAPGPEQECGECDTRRCRSPTNCLAGEVPDRCGCCRVCAQAEGQRCDNATSPSEGKFGPCGSDLVCVLRDDLKPQEEPESLCMCSQQQTVCASDGNSYDTFCQLMEESRKEGMGDLRMLHWGHCRSAPWIVSAPEPWSGPEHQRLALDCEAKGYPAPEVHWELMDQEGGSSVVLPADRSRCAVQLRGGPESHMVTSWLQLLDLSPEDQGNYSCVATNTEGQARAAANVHVFH